MAPSGTELAAALSVPHLESLARDCSGHHHHLRQLPGGLAQRTA
ncbi:hypothetical protein [Streptomyces sp. BE303]|nr:hypothetical protein [Streptomyces sp. BE303]MED7947293.1 hypothetical protein [Streptomyces sp. BE303]